MTVAHLRDPSIVASIVLKAPALAFRLAACALCIIVAIALRMVSHTDGDVSWLLYTADRTLAGWVPYRDFLEVNPPASIVMYIPAVLLARISGIRPEVTTDLLVFAAIGASLTLCARILTGAGVLDARRGLAMLCPVLAVLLILPFSSFGQREHIAVLALLPFMAVLTVRDADRTPPVIYIVLAGIGAGIAISIKPVFGLGLIGPALFLMRRVSWRSVIVQPEMWIAAAIVLAYGAAVNCIFPDYARRLVPLMVDIYLPARRPLLMLASRPMTCIWLGFVASFWQLRSRSGPLGFMLVLASIGFEAGYFIQGKGFDYHAYPAIAFAALAVAHALSGWDRKSLANFSICVLALAPALAAIVSSALTFGRYYRIADVLPGLEAAIASVSPHPRVLTISDKMDLGRTFAREIGGEWVGSTPLPWITVYASILTPHPDADPRYADAIRMERDVFAEDIERGNPNVIIIDGAQWLDWTLKGPALTCALASYSEIGRFNDFRLYGRALSAASISTDCHSSHGQRQGPPSSAKEVQG